jgi:hypothetical protein
MNRRAQFFVVYMLMLVVPICTRAQFVQRGGIEGNVFDASGAVVPNVQITLLDIAQDHTRQIKADGVGHFEFDNLTVGQYKLTASLQGFATETSESITVNIGKVEHYDFRLRTGSVEESVTVSEATASLETGQASMDTNVSAQQFEELPLNGRNFTSVAALAPGVSTSPQLNINPGGTYAVGAMFAMGGTQFSTGGIFEGSRDNGFYINGVNITENYESMIGFEPSAEALATATIGVADFSAANGHDISTLTLQTKGGSTRFHGEAYDFLENSDLNAFNPYVKALSESLLQEAPVKPTLERNQFGGNFSGPFYIPKLQPQIKNKVFFFANYEDEVESDGNVPNYGSVPSAAELTGDFSELLTSPVPIQLYNPFYTTYNSIGQSTRPEIEGNRLDLATRPDGSPLIDPSALAIQKALWPAANILGEPSNESNYFYTEHQGFSNYHIDTRFDGNITSKDSVFVTWSRSQGSNTTTGNIIPANLYIAEQFDRSWLVTGNYVHIFNAHLTNELTIGFGNGFLQALTPSEYSWLNSSSNPFNQYFQNTGSGQSEGVLSVTAGNYLSPGFYEPFGDSNRTTQFSDNLDWEVGRHTLTAGVSYLRKGEYDWQIARYVGFGADNSYYSGGFSTPGFSGGAALQNYTPGDGQADLEMGIPSAINQRFNFAGGGTAPQFWAEFPDWGMYVDDKFRIDPKLTVSVGLRYELDVPLYAPNKICCAVYSPSSDGGVLKIPGIAQGLPQHYLSTPKTDFAPRLSIAYSVNPQTVVRVGYGIFFDAGATQISNGILTAQNGIPGFLYGTSVNNATLGVALDTPALTLANVFPAPVNLSAGEFPVETAPGTGYFGDNQLYTVVYNDQKSAPLPYFQRMLLDIQRQVSPHDTVTLSYAGAQGRKGENEININLPTYQTGWTTAYDAYDAARPNNFGRFGDIYVNRPTLNSFYNAFIAQYRHDFSKGFQLMSNYTFGKTVSDYPWSNNNIGGAVGGGLDSGFQYPSSAGPGLYDRGESTLSHRHRFVYSGIWSPKYGGKWPPYLKEALTGWRITGTGTLESGDALTIVNNMTSALDHAGFDEMFASGNSNLSHGQRSFTRQFDTSKFTLPPENVRGNSGLGTVRGPGQDNLDLSLAKTFALYERLHLEFRVDAFNALNHSQWNGAETTYPQGSGSLGVVPFGEVTGAREARIGQVAAKLVF